MSDNKRKSLTREDYKEMAKNIDECISAAKDGSFEKGFDCVTHLRMILCAKTRYRVWSYHGCNVMLIFDICGRLSLGSFPLSLNCPLDKHSFQYFAFYWLSEIVLGIF